MEEDYAPRFPHCDELVLHSPESGCKYCDMFPELQQKRIKENINFTGEGNNTKRICPAEARRSLETINKWPGNRIDGWEMIMGSTSDVQ